MRGVAALVLLKTLRRAKQVLYRLEYLILISVRVVLNIIHIIHWRDSLENIVRGFRLRKQYPLLFLFLR